jgi:AhpD family alkylhydroperoxidase
MKRLLSFFAIMLVTLGAFAAEDPGHAAALKEIKRTFGIVPTFFKEYPQEGLAGAWDEFKAVQLNPKTALDAKTKDLIGLAVASQIPCRYCNYFHKKGITTAGGTKAEMNMAIALAADTRKWGTFFNGAQLDMAKFKADVDKMAANGAKSKDQGMMAASMPVTDANSAMQDIERVFGLVPDFIKAYPSVALAGAWNNVKGIILSPAVISQKNKSLINVAVSSQVPSSYCIYIDTQMAKMYGATDQELQESVAMAGIVRHWSTVLNGIQQDEKAFQREVDSIFNYIKKHQSPEKTKIGALSTDLGRDVK